jgi:hypothetical protein
MLLSQSRCFVRFVGFTHSSHTVHTHTLVVITRALGPWDQGPRDRQERNPPFLEEIGPQSSSEGPLEAGCPRNLEKNRLLTEPWFHERSRTGWRRLWRHPRSQAWQARAWGEQRPTAPPSREKTRLGREFGRAVRTAVRTTTLGTPPGYLQKRVYLQRYL